MKLINHKTYIEKMGTPDIKVITGVRRSGKAFKGYIEQNVPDCNIIHINLICRITRI